MEGFGVRHFVGVFDARMVQIYNRVGSSPEILGTLGEGRDAISVGLWEFEQDAQQRVAARAGITLQQNRLWFDHSFGGCPAEEFAVSA